MIGKELEIFTRDRDKVDVTLSDYLFRLLYTDYHWDCSSPLSQSLHKALTLILVPLHCDLRYHCTIRSDSSISSLCTVTS